MPLAQSKKNTQIILVTKRHIIKNSILLAVMPLFFSSCATLVAGGNPKILIDGAVDEPVTITTEKNVYSDVIIHEDY